ncbi:RNA-directed DNA polymerase, eukaryota [Tanacetum coccineum]
MTVVPPSDFSSQRSLGNKAKRRWIKELCQKHRINFASIQETKAESISLLTIKDLWGNQIFALMGTWAPTSSKLLIISVYAPQELNERRDLWDYLRTIIDRWEGDTVIMGDFNEVRSEHERSVLDLFPHLSALCLDRHLSDHRPILMRETNYDYGPSPFRFFHSWFAMEGFNSFVELPWNAMEISQKAKIRWSIEGDENSKYFHGIMNKKRSQLAIRGTFANGEWISEPQGALDTHKLIPRRSPWQDVILAIHSLQSKDINLMDFIQKKVGNGDNTSFWDDSWLGDVALKVL